MAEVAIVDAGFLIALLRLRDSHHAWAVAKAADHPPPWSTCEAALSETFFLLGNEGLNGLGALLERGTLRSAFSLAEQAEPVVALMKKYVDVPMSLADACLVRMTELAQDSRLLTTDTDFRIYRRNGRQTVPCIMPE